MPPSTLDMAVRTPCEGLVMRRTPTGIPVVAIYFTADEAKNSFEWAQKEFRKQTSYAYWQQEMLIKYEAHSGQLVYPEFDERFHVIPDSQIPTRLCRYMAIDPHPRTPHAMLWIGIDQWSDWYAYRELWPSRSYGNSVSLKDHDIENEYVTREYAETIAMLEGNSIEWRNPEKDDEYGVYRQREGGERIVYRFMDQAGKAFRASGEDQAVESFAARYDRFGIQCQDPYKVVKTGEDAVHDLLKLRRHETRGAWSRLHIAESLVELRLEFQRFRYRRTPRWTDQKELKQDGVEARRHMLDSLRYLATSNISFIPSLAS